MARETTSGENQNRFAGRFCLLLGLAMVFAGLVCNQWLLGAVAGSGDAVSDPADLVVIWAFQAITLIWGLVNLLFRRRPIIAKLNLSMVSLLIVSPLLGELAIRIAIGTRVSAVCQAGLYADAMSDDDFWKLSYLWMGGQDHDPRMIQDELLGWKPPFTTTNPLGVISEQPYVVDSERPAILFFGDSFVDSPVASPGKIPERLNTLLPEAATYNFGVSGYGVDQIFLRIKSSHQPFRQPFILVGVLTSDLDRCALSFRGAPKPYYVVDGEQLTLKGAPLGLDADEWIRANPPRIGSFLWSFAKMRYRLHQPGEFREQTYKRAEKERINTLLLQEIVAYCRERHLPFRFVLFYEPTELEQTGWRESFLQTQMRRLEVEFIDTKPVLLDHMEHASLRVSDYYRSDHHLNAQGNDVVARALAASLKGFGAANP